MEIDCISSSILAEAQSSVSETTLVAISEITEVVKEAKEIFSLSVLEGLEVDSLSLKCFASFSVLSGSRGLCLTFAFFRNKLYSGKL